MSNIARLSLPPPRSTYRQLVESQIRHADISEYLDGDVPVHPGASSPHFEILFHVRTKMPSFTRFYPGQMNESYDAKSEL
jgi:hypothetical protein